VLAQPSRRSVQRDDGIAESAFGGGNYREAGAVQIILAGVIETQIERDRHQDALSVPLAMCRLRVDLPLVRARLAQRHEAESEVLQWYVARSGELDTILEAAAIEDFTVDATNLSIASTAKTVLSTVGWQGPFPSP
jgi:adenylylsulfate kinase